MRTVTVGDFKNLGRKDVFSDDPNSGVYRIYAIRGDGCYLYVGKSKDAISRMMNHLQLGVQDIDSLIRRSTADQYEVDLYTEKDICHDIFKRLPGALTLTDEEIDMRAEYQRRRCSISEEDFSFVNGYTITFAMTSITMDGWVSVFENTMIWEHSPVFNGYGCDPNNNTNSDRWYSIHPANGCANDGIILSD